MIQLAFVGHALALPLPLPPVALPECIAGHREDPILRLIGKLVLTGTATFNIDIDGRLLRNPAGSHVIEGREDGMYDASYFNTKLLAAAG